MKKSFYFALALTAGLFASCSSDDLTADAPQQEGIEINDNNPVQIQIGVGTPGTTRGTGSVGTTDIGATTANTWQGQKFNLFMFHKGTFKPASYIDPDNGKNVEVYNDTEMTTKRGQNMAVQLDENGVELFNYFPNSTTPYSFWAYRLDDAWVDDAGKAGWENGDATKKVITGIPAYTAGTTTYTWEAYTGNDDATLNGTADPTTETVGTVGAIYENTSSNDKFECTAVNTGSGSYGEDPATVTMVEIPFKINGSQDIMIATTQESAAAAALIAADTKTTDANVNDRIYTAYAARRGVYPDLKFKHQLARLYFEIKAFDRQVSEQADKKTTDPNEYKGFKITGISVWSKNSGTLVAAYKGTDEPTRITWNDGVEELKIMQRAAKNEKADIYWVTVSAGFTGDLSLTSGGNNVPTTYRGDVTTLAISNSTVLYPNQDRDQETGLPSSQGKANSEYTAGTLVYYPLPKPGYHSDNTTTWDKQLITTDDSLNLEPIPAEGISLKWDGYAAATTGTDQWQEFDEAILSYTWSAGTTTKPAGVNDADITVITKAPTDQTVGVENKWYSLTMYGTTTYYQCTAIVKNTAGAINLGNDKAIADLTAANAVDANNTAISTNNIYYTTITTTQTQTKKYFKYASTGTALEEGHTVATRIGESLLVAPSDAQDGLKVKVYFKRCKKLTGAKVQEIPGESEFMVKSSDGAFKANSRYKVTAIMYQDGAAQPGNVSLEGEDNGTTEYPDYDL